MGKYSSAPTTDKKEMCSAMNRVEMVVLEYKMQNGGLGL